jgi:hypothetical protein
MTKTERNKLINKTERNKLINKQVYRLVELWDYEVDTTETDVVFYPSEGDNNDTIEYRRSNHTVACLNWASKNTLRDVELIEEYIDMLKEMSDEQLLVEYQGA